MATYQTIFVDCGVSWSSKIPIRNKSGLPIDLTGFYARGQIRKHWASKKKQEFGATIVDPTSGIIYISLTSDQTRAMKPGRFMFDIELYNNTITPSQVIRVLEGQVVMVPRITVGSEETSISQGSEYEAIVDDGWFYDEW